VAKIIEIVGVSGVGKSTIAKNISEHFPEWDISFRLPKRDTIAYQLLAIMNNFLPIFIYSEKDHFFNNLKLIAHIYALTTFIEKKRDSDGVLIFDQGVIFEYAYLCNFGLKNAPENYKKLIYSKYVSRYFKSLNVFVFLSASADIVLKRVMLRKSDHRLKQFSELEKINFIKNYNDIYNYIKVDLEGEATQIINIDTGKLSSESVFNQFLDELKM
tara:strand:- start:178 stop:822 length:645 start_codon:yes stop_codon:yes gene_type:complete